MDKITPIFSGLGLELGSPKLLFAIIYICMYICIHTFIYMPIIVV